MLRRAARNIPLRRCLHTPATPAARQTRSGRLAMAGAASIAVVSYFTWRAQTSKISLDTKPSPPPATTARPTVQHEPSQVDKDLEPKDQASRPPESTDASPPDGEESDKGPEAAGAAAFNPDTGEINWDCPCLGGMAHGPCGLQFREAFSCFVFSEQDPKGIDCVEKFKTMQDCFREHPDIYGEEIEDQEDSEQSSEPSDLSPITSTKESSSQPSDSPVEGS